MWNDAYNKDIPVSSDHYSLHMHNMIFVAGHRKADSVVKFNIRVNVNSIKFNKIKYKRKRRGRRLNAIKDYSI